MLMKRPALILVAVSAILFAGCSLLPTMQGSVSTIPPASRVCVVPAPDLCGKNFFVTGYWAVEPNIHGWNVIVLPGTSEKKITAIADELASTQHGRRFAIFFEGTPDELDVPPMRGPSSIDGPLAQPTSDRWRFSFDYVGDIPPVKSRPE